jgi:uncharacterized protein GlcG (DUF336 family)
MRLATARTLVDAAITHAESIDARATVCVLDAGANVVLQARMDGAALMRLRIAHDKAHTAVGLDMPSGELQEHLQPGAFLYGFSTPGLLPLGGGFPVHQDGVLVGAIGVSGPSTDADLAIAQAALEAL